MQNDVKEIAPQFIQNGRKKSIKRNFYKAGKRLFDLFASLVAIILLFTGAFTYFCAYLHWRSWACSLWANSNWKGQKTFQNVEVP